MRWKTQLSKGWVPGCIFLHTCSSVALQSLAFTQVCTSDLSWERKGELVKTRDPRTLKWNLWAALWTDVCSIVHHKTSNLFLNNSSDDYYGF